MIDAAFARHGTPEIVNTDQGSQFMGVARYPLGHRRDVHRGRPGERLQAVDGWAGAWRDNVFVERVWCSVKYERVYLQAYDSVSAARADIADTFTGTTRVGRIRV